MSSKNNFSEKNYSEEGFWNKVGSYAKSIGKETLEIVFKLYYSAKDSDTPIWAKTAIFGALAYLISPIDAIPDVIPVAGYTDDAGVLTAAIAAVAAYIKDEHVKKAKETLERWFS